MSSISEDNHKKSRDTPQKSFRSFVRRHSLCPKYTPGIRAHPESQNAQLKNIRLHLSSKKPDKTIYQAKDDRILVRRENQLLIERPEDLWRRHFKRREKNLEKGFYSTQWEPYLPIGGDLILDGIELLQKTLLRNTDISSKPHSFLGRASRKQSTFPHDSRLTKLIPHARKVSLKEKKLRDDADSGPAIDVAPKAGFKEVHDKIAETKKRIVAVRGGLPYEHHVKRINDLKLASGEDPMDNDMLLVSLSNLQFSIPEIHKPYKPPTLTVSSDGEDLSQKMLVEKVCSFMKPVTPAKSHLISAVSNISDKRRRLQEDQVNFLENIYVLLTSIHNMKLKDLKSKNPLTPEQVKLLRREFMYNTQEPDGKLNSSRRSNNNRLSMDTLSGTGSTASNIDSGKFLLKRRNTIITPQANRRKSKWSGGAETWDDFLDIDMDANNQALAGTESNGQINNVYNPHISNVNNQALPDITESSGRLTGASGPVFSPWLSMSRHHNPIPSDEFSDEASSTDENLELDDDDDYDDDDDDDEKRRISELDLNNQALPAIRDALNNISFNLVCKTVRWKRRRGGALVDTKDVNTLEGMEREKKNIPLWQVIASQDRVGGSLFKDVRSKKEISSVADKVVKKSQVSLFKLKQALKEEYTEQLQKIERERMVSFKYKYGLFEDLSPIFEEHQKYLKQSHKFVEKHKDIYEIKPSQWYDELMENVTSNFRGDMKVQLALSKISRFSQMNARTVLHAKAKLCLLVMSLPVDEICLIQMQKAIVFVLEQILHSEMEQFLHWLEIRKLPYVVHTKSESD